MNIIAVTVLHLYRYVCRMIVVSTDTPLLRVSGPTQTIMLLLGRGGTPTLNFGKFLTVPLFISS